MSHFCSCTSEQKQSGSCQTVFCNCSRAEPSPETDHYWMCHFHLSRTAPTNIVILKYFRFSLKLIKLCIITQLTMTAMTKIVTLFEIQLSVRIIGNTKLCSTQFNIWLNELIDCDRSQKCIRVITYLAKNWFSHFTGITLEFITGGWNF